MADREALLAAAREKMCEAIALIQQAESEQDAPHKLLNSALIEALNASIDYGNGLTHRETVSGVGSFVGNVVHMVACNVTAGPRAGVVRAQLCQQVLACAASVLDGVPFDEITTEPFNRGPRKDAS